MERIKAPVEIANSKITGVLPVVLTMGLLVSACSDSDNSTGVDFQPGAVGTEQSSDTTTTTMGPATTETTAVAMTAEAVKEEAKELIDNIYNNPGESFRCLIEGNETGTMKVVVHEDGTPDVGQVLTHLNIKVDTENRFDDTKPSTDAIGPYTVASPEDKEALGDNVYATWCENPGVLGSVLRSHAVAIIDGEKVPDTAEWLKPFDVDIEDLDAVVEELLMIPHVGSPLTEEQFEENVQRTKERVALAEKLANVHMSEHMINLGVFQDVDIDSRYAHVTVDSAYNGSLTDMPEYWTEGEYNGDVIRYAFNKKGEICATITFNYNIDDHAPVSIEEDCEPGTTTTTIPTTSTTSPTTTTTTIPTTTTTTIPTTTTTTSPTTTTTTPEKVDDGKLPGDDDVPADQDNGTPDEPGEGPAGQETDDEGYVDGENRPEKQTTTTIGVTTTTVVGPTATTSVPVTSTSAPVIPEDNPTVDEPETGPLPDTP